MKIWNLIATIGFSIAEFLTDGNKIISAGHLLYSTASSMYFASQGEVIDALVSSIGVVSSTYHLLK
ncbi:hypothetical protein [Saccharolobus caldissimus]|uniref:Uncharacterized protein n=1 Tax=Saccharolobus caldissimus TaxID=1702097 RepID=A0AAQ4CUV5_9CREN|nr:hypothetical protein [Saccharolobus caldissimus]BDB99586.1 hypothetical protein SACC_26030 [Saccharolobus caldissimus]